MAEQDVAPDAKKEKKPEKRMSMEATFFKVRVVCTESILGTQPQKDIALAHVMSQITDPETGEPPADEVGTLPEELEKGTTAFHHLPDGTPLYYDYMVKGFFKDVGGNFNGLRGVLNLKSKIENFVYIRPRQIVLNLPPGGVMTYCTRPLRAQTAQGPRTSIARSEELPAGTWFDFWIKLYTSGPITETILRDILGYGGDRGFGQWRNSGHGRFEYEMEPADYVAKPSIFGLKSEVA